MNKIFTKEQIAKLKEFERDFHTSIHLKYKRNNTRADLDKMACIYEECTGVKISREFQCPQCQFTLVCRVGELYYASVDYWNKQDEAEKENEMQEIAKDNETVQEITEVKPRRSYKKKKE